MHQQPLAEFTLDIQQATLICRGVWTAATVNRLAQQVVAAQDCLPILHIDGQGISRLDTAGAWFLLKLARQYTATSTSIDWVNFAKKQRALLELLMQQEDKVYSLSQQPPVHWLTRLGMQGELAAVQIHLFLTFIGEVSLYALGWLRSPGRIQWKLLLNIIERSGYQALPITGLLAFLIGIVLTYQMGLQLRTYGANIYIVNLLGLSILREFSPLITAIIIAGRSGSAFTAQLCTMKVHEEMDALRTMGIAPLERLVLPRLLGLTLVLPLLTLWSDILGICGGMVMSYHMLDINYSDFIVRFKEVMQLKTLLIGLLKAPIFAMIVASIGCFQGFQVTGSADSVGQLTTRSVVQAIFLIICADAFFSVLLSWYKI